MTALSTGCAAPPWPAEEAVEGAVLLGCDPMVEAGADAPPPAAAAADADADAAAACRCRLGGSMPSAEVP